MLGGGDKVDICRQVICAHVFVCQTAVSALLDILENICACLMRKNCVHGGFVIAAVNCGATKYFFLP